MTILTDSLERSTQLAATGVRGVATGSRSSRLLYDWWFRDPCYSSDPNDPQSAYVPASASLVYPAAAVCALGERVLETGGVDGVNGCVAIGTSHKNLDRLLPGNLS